jgi:hypothetical protein
VGELARQQPLQGTRALPGYGHACGFAAGVSDAEALAAVRLDRRWPLVRDGLACAAPPLRKATVGRFPAALIKPGVDRRLGEGTLELATPVRFDRIFRNRIFQALYDGARMEWRVILA